MIQYCVFCSKKLDIFLDPGYSTGPIKTKDKNSKCCSSCFDFYVTAAENKILRDSKTPNGKRIIEKNNRYTLTD